SAPKPGHWRGRRKRRSELRWRRLRSRHHYSRETRADDRALGLARRFQPPESRCRGGRRSRHRVRRAIRERASSRTRRRHERYAARGAAMRLCTLPICAGLLLAPHANADEAGLEAGFGLVDSHYFSHLDDDWRGHTGIGHAGGAFWRKPVATGDRRSLLVGARLGGLFHLGGAAYPWYVDLDVAGALIANDPREGRGSCGASALRGMPAGPF